jgi:hypothetical protein
MPLVHTSNPDFLERRLWLGFPLTSKASFVKFTTHQDSRTKASQDSRIQQVPGFLIFGSFQAPWNRQLICELKPIRLLISHIIRRSARCIKFVRIFSWMLPFRETELFILRLTHEYAYEFSKPDVSRVIGFYPIPQQVAQCNFTWYPWLQDFQTIDSISYWARETQVWNPYQSWKANKDWSAPLPNQYSWGV